MTSVEITFLALNVAAIVMLVSFVVHLIVLHQTKYELAGYQISLGNEVVFTKNPEEVSKFKYYGATVEEVYRVANR